VHEKSIAEQRSVAHHMGSHNVSPPATGVTPVKPASRPTPFIYRRGMEGWVDFWWLVIYRGGSFFRR